MCGPADRTAPILRIDTPNGRLRAVLFGAAVHGTTLGGDIYELCGDYAGFAQAYVEEKHPSVQAMFMIGCAGDANPYPRGTMELARKHGDELGEEVCRVLESKLRPVRGPLKIAFARADLPLQEPPPRELKAAIISRLKLMAKLNIAERRLPQDGRIKLKILGHEVDLRVSTLPTLYGESVVMRLLDRSAGDFYDLRGLGFDDRMLADIGLTRRDVREAFSEPIWRDPTDLLAERVAGRRR